MQGPWCPALLDYLGRHHKSYDALIFFTYLYAPTLLGIQIDPQRSILVPTAHDEPAIHLDIYKEMFRQPAAIAYNTEVEKNFLKTTFAIRTVAEETVGCGVDLMQGDVGEGEPAPPRDGEEDVDVLSQIKSRGARVPPPPSPAGRLSALRGQDRSGQGLRGVAGVFHQLQRTRWRGACWC